MKKGNTMRVLFIALACVMALTFTSCGYKVVKKNAEPEVAAPAGDTLVVKMGKDRTNMVILQELLSNGEIINKDVHSHSWLAWSAKEQKYIEVDYNWEMWVIKTGEDYHAAIFEFGRLVDIEPVKDLEDARIRFKPYGGWDKVK